MTEAAPAVAPAETSAPTAPEVINPAERLQLVKEAAAKEAKEPKAKDPEKAAEAAPVDHDKERAERKKRIEEMNAKSRERIAKNDQRKARSASPPQDNPDEIRIPKARAAEIAEYEKALSSEDEFLSLAEKRGITADKLAAHIKDRLQNPERIASRHADRMATETEKRVADQLRQRDDRIAHLEARLQARDDETVAARYNEQFISHVREHARTAPLTARYLERYGREKFLQYATRCAELVPAGSGPQAVQDMIEQTLEDIQLGPTEPSPKTKQAPAAVKASTATTVTNSLASQQTEVLDDDAFARLTPDERLKIVKARKD